MIITSLYTNLQNALTTSIVYHVYMYCEKDWEYSKRKIDEYERENEFCDMIIDNKMWHRGNTNDDDNEQSNYRAWNNWCFSLVAKWLFIFDHK